MLPVPALIAAGFGVLFGAPTLRLRGDYLAIVTLGFGEIVPIVVRNVDSVTNGAAGLNGIQAPRLLGHSFGVAAWPYYYVGIAMVALLIFVSIRLRDSRIGRAWMAIREDATAAAGPPARAEPGWRSAKTRPPQPQWASTAPAPSFSPSPSEQPSPAPPAPS